MQVRSTVSDFAVFLTIIIMVLLDYLVGVPTPKLKVPDHFQVKVDSNAVKLLIITLCEDLYCVQYVYCSCEGTNMNQMCPSTWDYWSREALSVVQ